MAAVRQHFTSKCFKVSIINELHGRQQFITKILVTVARVMTRKCQKIYYEFAVPLQVLRKMLQIKKFKILYKIVFAI